MLLRLAAAPGARSSAGQELLLSVRDALLLAWLALEGPTSRTRLALLLWPDSPPAAARNNLRQRLFQLKRLLGGDVVVGGDTLVLGPEIRHDLGEASDLLAGETPPLAGELAAWLSAQRERLAHRRCQALAEAADAAEALHDWPAALALAAQVLSLQPVSESAYRRLMRLHYLAGDRSAGLHAFDRCKRVLEHEVGVSPSAETMQLRRLLEVGTAAPAPRPGAVPAALRRPPQAVGRAAELQQLHAAWQGGRRFLVSGEPGIGKSRLLQALAEDWPGALVVGARPGDAEVPMALLLRLVEALVGQTPARARDEAMQALRSALAGPQPADDAAASGGAVLVRPSPRPLRPLLLAALQACGEDSPALLFDDWQFADDASVELLEYVMDLPPLADGCIGLASRTGAGPVAEARLTRLRERSSLCSVPLQALDDVAVASLVASVGLAAPDVPALATRLVQCVGGNPLYLLEALRHLLQSGQSLVPETVAVPAQVRDLVVQRLGTLPERARQLLYAAAVAQPGFGVDMAQAVTGRDALELAEAWQVLERQGLLGPQGIAHDVYTEAVLSQLPQSIGRVLHARVSEFLERAAPSAAREPARLAHHWRAAGQDERAVPHLLAAARQAWHTARARDCFAQFEQAAQIEALRGEEARAFDLWFDNADAMTEMGTPAQVRACLTALQGLAQTEVHRLRVRLVQSVLQFMQGQVEQAAVEVGSMLGDAIALRDVRVECECRFAIANRAAADGRFDDALQHLAAGERLMRDAGDARRASALAASMTLVLGLRGQSRLALGEQQRMLPLLRAEGDQTTWTVVCASKALQHMRQGDLDGALQEVRRALGQVEHGAIAAPDLGMVMRSLIDALRWSPCLGEALQVAEVLQQRLAAMGDPARAREPMAALYLQLGRPDLAQPLLNALAQSPPARTREQWRLQLLLQQLALSTGRAEPGPWPAEALGGEDLALAAEWALWAGLVEASVWPPGALSRLTTHCRAGGQVLFTAALQALQSWRCAVEGGSSAAAEWPIRPDQLVGLHGATPWVALYAGLAWQARHQAPVARQLVLAGVTWLHEVVRPTLPTAFQMAYLERQPLHRALLALRARL